MGKENNEKVNTALNELKLWERLVLLEETVFGRENPGSARSSRLSALSNQIVEIHQKIAGLERKIYDLQSVEQNYKDLEKEKEKLEKRFSELENDNKDLKNQLDINESRLAQSRNENASLTESLQESKNTNEYLVKQASELEKRIAIANAQIDSLIKQKEEYKEKIESFIKQKEDSQKQISYLEETKEGFRKDLVKKSEELLETRTKMNQINGQLESTEKELIIAKENIESLSQELNEKGKTLDNTRTAFQSVQQEYNTLKEDQEKLTCLYSQTKDDLKKEKEEREAYFERFGDWDEDTQCYQDLMRCMYRCESLSKMIELYGMEKNLNGEDVYSVIKFVGLLGNQTTFLPILYDSLEKYKQVHKSFLSEEEIEFINALNQYYRSSFRVNYDFLQFPENNARFDKNSMSDMFNRGKIYRTVEGVYVPAIMRDATTYLKMALVRGN